MENFDPNTAIRLALEHHQAGRTQQAAALYEQILAGDPEHVDALHLSGVLAHSSGESQRGAALIQRAVELEPNSAAAYSNLGCALHACRDLDGAEHAYRKAIDLSPAMAEAHSSLGWLLQERGQFDLAVASYRAALALKPDFADALANLGAVLHEQHHLDEALACYARILAFEPTHLRAYVNLGGTLLKQGQPAKALDYLQQGIALHPRAPALFKNLGAAHKALGQVQASAAAYKRALEMNHTSLEGMESAVKLAVLAYLQDDLTLAAEALSYAAPLHDLHGRLVDAPRAYLIFLGQLLKLERERQPDAEATLHVIGDSHCLSMHGVHVTLNGIRHQGVAHWVEGCKQWHLGNGARNQHKCGFEAALGQVPHDAPTLVMFGEIDCRPHSGIFGAWEKNSARPLDWYVDATINGFIDYLAQTGRRRLIVCGVPAPARESVDLNNPAAAQFLDMVAQFNQRLNAAARRSGMGFLDTYAMTVGAGRLAAEDWHIDQCHLKPAAYTEAFLSLPVQF